MKPGYKQTEVGIIPEDWEVKQIREFAKICMCKRIFADQTADTGDIPFYKIGTFGNKPDAYIPRALYNEYRDKYSFPKTGDILISAAGTLGRTVVFNGSDSYYQDSNIVWLDIDKRVICNEYLKHYYKVIQWAASEGSTISRLYNGIIESTYVALPPLHEQQRIAEALSDMDEQIATMEKLIAKKKAIKQGAMQELLTGKRRLPGFSGEWKTSPLITLCDSITDGSHESPLETDCGYYMPSVKDMTDCGFNYSACKQISKLDYEKLVRNGCQPVVGDVLIAKDGSILKHAFVYEQSVPTVILSSIAIIRPNKAIIDSQYLAQYFRQKSFVENVILNYKSGTGVPRIVLNNFKIIEIFHPISVKEQIAISETLGYIDVDIEMQEKKVEKARQIKQGMMQQLLTGRIRI